MESIMVNRRLTVGNRGRRISWPVGSLAGPGRRWAGAPTIPILAPAASRWHTRQN